MKQKQIKYVPKGAGVLIKAVAETESKIILSEEAQREKIMSDKQEILVCGSNCEETKVGDLVNFISYAQPVAVLINNEEYFVLQEREILGYYK